MAVDLNISFEAIKSALEKNKQIELSDSDLEVMKEIFQKCRIRCLYFVSKLFWHAYLTDGNSLSGKEKEDARSLVTRVRDLDYLIASLEGRSSWKGDVGQLEATLKMLKEGGYR